MTVYLITVVLGTALLGIPFLNAMDRRNGR